MRPRPVEVNLICVADFDAMGDPAAEAHIRPSCASERWIAYVVRKRPYELLPNVIGASDDAIRVMDWPDVEQAIGPLTASGAQTRGRARTGPSAFEHDEMRAGVRAPGVAAAPGAEPGSRPALPSAALAAAIAGYEEQFGHPLLMSQPGRSATDLLDQVRLRLAHDVETERRVVRADLRKIVRLRLAASFQVGEAS